MPLVGENDPLRETKILLFHTAYPICEVEAQWIIGLFDLLDSAVSVRTELQVFLERLLQLASCCRPSRLAASDA